MSYADAQWLNRQADALNDVIFNEVAAARRAGVHITYVPPSLFGGHGLCDHSDAWLNGVVLDSNVPPGPQSESFHPTVTGYLEGYGNVFALIMKYS